MSIQDILKKYLGSNTDAYVWCSAYIILAHAIDDLCDGDKTDYEHINKTFEFAAKLYSDLFYRNHIHLLYPLVIMSSNSYTDSISMNKSNSTWKKQHGDVLRHNANDVTLMCIEIVGGIDARREASMQLRELSYKQHHTLEGVPC